MDGIHHDVLGSRGNNWRRGMKWGPEVGVCIVVLGIIREVDGTLAERDGKNDTYCRATSSILAEEQVKMQLTSIILGGYDMRVVVVVAVVVVRLVLDRNR